MNIHSFLRVRQILEEVAAVGREDHEDHEDFEEEVVDQADCNQHQRRYRATSSPQVTAVQDPWFR